MKLAPKRPMSAFLMYAQQKRRQLQRENPDVPNSDISRLLGEIWRGTAAAEKRPFLEREEAERRMYKAKMAKWKNDQKLEKSVKSLPDRRQDVASCAREETHPRYGEERSQDVRVCQCQLLRSQFPVSYSVSPTMCRRSFRARHKFDGLSHEERIDASSSSVPGESRR